MPDATEGELGSVASPPPSEPQEIASPNPQTATNVPEPPHTIFENDPAQGQPQVGKPAEKSEIGAGGAAAPSDNLRTSKTAHLEADDASDETYGSARSNLLSVTFDPSLNLRTSEFLDAERKSGRLALRSTQAMIHSGLTFARIEALERQLQELQKIVEDNGKDRSYTPIKLKFPVFLHKLRRCAPSDFILTNETVRLPASQQPAIEVSVSQSSPSHPETMDDRSQNTSTQASFRVPERILIRSRSLLAYLDEVLDTNLLRSVGESRMFGEYQTVFYSLVFLRPFKFFVLNEEKIRNSAHQLGERMATTAIPDQPGPVPAIAGNRDAGEDKQYADKDLKQDLDLLIEVLDSDLKATFNLRKNIKGGVDVEVEYEDLWHVFQRGDIVISRQKPEHAFRLLNFAGGRDPLSHGPFVNERLKAAKAVEGFVLDCCYFNSNGVSYVPLLEHFSIRKFLGTQRITDLPYFPIKFHPGADGLSKDMIERGRLFVDITRQPFQHMVAKRTTQNEPRQEIDGQIIVDMLLAIKANPGLGISPEKRTLTAQDPRELAERPYCGHFRDPTSFCCGSHSIHADHILDDEDNSRFLVSMGGNPFKLLAVDEVTEENYMLMRPHVHAFVLRSRQWVTLSVSDLGQVIFESSFEDLRIPEEHKKVVQALVKTHEAGNKGDAGLKAQSIGAAMDIVKGKGRGLIILLHGAPGVGKTSTAECVADDTRRPLYPITCGDIGETALEVERNLHNSFQLAQKWGCVLLLDEADVFLAKRTRSDLRHNAVTSVFLRSLEYYSGILFLTTNRVGVMDLAFKSRIQMTLFYPKLDLQVTLKLYEIFTERAKKEQDQRGSHRFRIKEKEILRFAKKHYTQLERDGLDTWNGRQIRNAFQTAIALAEYEATEAGQDDPKPVLGKKQFESVAISARKFDEYLTSTTGKSESDAARTDAWRDDRFSGAAPPGAPARSLTEHRAPRGSQKRATVLEFDTDSESDSDGSRSEEDSETEEEEEERKTRARRSRKAAVSSKSPRRKAKDKEGDSASAAEYRQFLEWQKMRQEQGKA